jgi:hypothetical protein
MRKEEERKKKIYYTIGINETSYPFTLYALCKNEYWIGSLVLIHDWLNFSMTSLLTHTVAISTKPSFRSKTNNQPLKKFLSLVVSWLKFVKTCKILTFKVNFLCQKLFKSNFFFHWKISFWGHIFCYWHFLKTSIFKPLYFLKWRPIFDDLYSTDRKT